MVRLKECYGKESVINIEFQFHYGSVKSGKHKFCLAYGTGFQFHYGSVKST